ncbi:MAG: carbon-nitrogen hydrolase family protein [Wenzhouxiangellaceae bacterium]
MSQQHRVAVIQAAPQAFDTSKTLSVVDHWIKQAAAAGASLAVFPEAFVGGYPKGLDFGARVGMRELRGRQDFARYYEGAIAVPGPELQQLQEMAAAAAIDVVIGVIERSGGTLYCTAVMINAQGEYMGKHRKLMPTAMERLIWGFGDGSTLPVVEFTAGRTGAVICWENQMPLLRMAMYAQGVQIYCAPTVDDRDTWQHTMRHIAFEGRCFVLAACQYARRSDYPEDYACIQGDDPETVLIRGGSCIISPLGEMLAGPVYDQQALLVADIDRQQIVQGQYDLDVCGHYARPDIFTLHVNQAVQQPVCTVSDDHSPLSAAPDEAGG